MTIKLEVVTAEKKVFADDVDIIIAPGVDGELGILPHHAPLMTMLKPGEVLIRKGGVEISLAVTGGFIEARPDRVIILADAAERAEEIDVTRAEAARKRAQEQLAHPEAVEDTARAQAALQRAMARLGVAENIRKRKAR